MATLTQLVERTRMELADTPKMFNQTIRTTGDTNIYELSYAPVRAASCTVYLDARQVPDYPTEGIELSGVQIEETTGRVIFDFYPPADMDLTVMGTHFRYFTDEEMQQIVETSFSQHTANRADTYGRPITLERLDGIEEYPVALLSTIQAVQILMTDAAFDIDIYAPDGINIPRSQRFRQLEEMLANLKDRYRDLCMALNIGMYKVEVLTLRRISARTGRYVPVYRPMEIDDRGRPERVILPTPTYGSTPQDTGVPTLDLLIYQGDTFSQTIPLPKELPVHAVLTSQVRGYPGSPAIAGQFAIQQVDARTIILHMPADQTRNLPSRAVWDLQVVYPLGSGDFAPSDFGGDFSESPDAPTVTETWLRGAVSVPREITTSQAPVVEVNGLTTQTSPPVSSGSPLYGGGQLWPYP